MLWMADGDTGTVGAEHEAALRSTCRHSQQYRKVKPLVLFYFCGWGGQKNGIHLYILHQASWRPQCVSTAALGVPLSLQGQLCSHEAPANCKMEKPKGTKFRMSDALGKKNQVTSWLCGLPSPPSCRRVFLLLYGWISHLVHFHPWAALTSLYYNLTSHGRPLETAPFSFKHLF